MTGTPATPILAVTGSQVPYIFDLPHLLSLPRGFECRFRYRHHWVAKDVIKEAIKGDRALAGRSIVLLFHSQENKRLIPIRGGTILGVESIGPMIFVRFRVGEFVCTELDINRYKYPTLESTVEAASGLASLAHRLFGNIDGNPSYDLGHALPPEWYLRFASEDVGDNFWNANKSATAWAQIAAVLQCEPTMSGMPFFHVLGFQTENGDPVAPVVIRNSFNAVRDGVYGFPLVESHRYRMRVAEWCEPSKASGQPPLRVKCDFNKQNIELEGSSDLVVGRYDVLEFTFVTTHPGYSEIALRAELLKNSKASEQPATVIVKIEPGAPVTTDVVEKPLVPAWTQWPEVFMARVPIVVKVDWKRLVVPGASVVVGGTMYAVSVAASLDQTWKSTLQVLGLGILYFGAGALHAPLERLLKLSANLKKFSDGPEAWEKASKD